MLKSACVKKTIGQWLVTFSDNDVIWPRLSALKSHSWSGGRVWFLQIWLASPGAVTYRRSSSPAFQSLSTWGTGHLITVLAAHPTFFLGMEIALLSSCILPSSLLDLSMAHVSGVPLAPASLGKLIMYFFMVTDLFFPFPHLSYNLPVLETGRRQCSREISLK